MKTVKPSPIAERMPAFDAEHTIAAVDSELWRAIERENHRQHDHIELIASENYVSPAVMQAQGSQLTNKYAEGYPGRRYYGVCEFVDIVERLAIDRVKSLFGAEYANVQPHSGSQANQAVYLAVLKPGDAILGMSLAHGGHLTHGAPVNVSGKLFHAFGYGLRPDTEEIDYDSIQQLAEEHKPKMIVAGASAYSRTIDWRRFREIADSIGAYLTLSNPSWNRRLRHQYDTQDTSRPARWLHPRGRAACEGTQLACVSGAPRWAIDARDCRQGGGFQRSARSQIQGLSETSLREFAHDGARTHGARCADSLWRH